MSPFVVPIVAICCGTLLALVAILKGKGPRKEGPEDNAETRTIQELYVQCNRLADRIEALETIILEQERKQKKS